MNSLSNEVKRWKLTETDKQFAELISKLRLIEGATRGLKGTVIATGIAAAAVVIAVLGWGGQMFMSGMDTRIAADRAAQSAAEAVEQRMSDELQRALRAIRMEAPPPAPSEEQRPLPQN